MKCPSCTDIPLTMSERQGVEIDYCPQCRGVWLDRGELDKLIERAATMQPASSRSAQSQPQPQPQPQFVDSDHDHDHDHRRSHSGKRHKSWLGQIFD